MKDIIIVGSGWYGLHAALLLQDKYNVTVLEKEQDIFMGSSNYNQNRLHLGYHYPRCNKTRKICIEGYFKFIKKYREVVDFIDNNFYCISNNSLIDYETYLQIFNSSQYNHMILKNNFLKNINGDIINTQEKIINSENAKKYFKKNIKCNIKLNYNVTQITEVNGKVLVNNELTCDILFDCTYNQLNLSKNKYIYENTISLLYERKNFDIKYDSITIMDGPFFSLFPRDINKNIYTLTHVLHTPFFQSNNIVDVMNNTITDEKINTIKNKMENEIKNYLPQFNKDYTYLSYFTSYKCKIVSNNDNRDCVIEKNGNIISVNCGKITGIFEFEKYIEENILPLL